MKTFWYLILAIFTLISPVFSQQSVDYLREMQLRAIEANFAEWGYWGVNPAKYTGWTNHSNRLIPVYVYGGTLDRYQGTRSAYRCESRLKEIYGPAAVPSIDPHAEYFDQTDIFRLQVDAYEAGKRNIILLIFDGMDWQTTQAAAIYQTQRIGYSEGRGSGLAFLDYRGAPTDYGFMATSANYGDAKPDVDRQLLREIPIERLGGYSAQFGGRFPWSVPVSPEYLLGSYSGAKHIVTDSASSATSMISGIKTYNSGINVDLEAKSVEPFPRFVQRNGFTVGVVTNVPISHATPAAAYANNIDRDDYQDLTRDLIGLPSVSHPKEALTGVDVLIGAGHGEIRPDDTEKQGKNYFPGNKFLSDEDLAAIDIQNGGRYVLSQRTPGKNGKQILLEAAADASSRKSRLLGFYGTKGGHLPYRTADGQYDPTRGQKYHDQYSVAEIEENPTLADMTRAALTVLGSHTDAKGLWLMVEAGDVDWANHNNNIDDAIGAVISGDEAFIEIVNWIEANGCWDETLLIVTADHGHFFNLTKPEALIAPPPAPAATSK